MSREKKYEASFRASAAVGDMGSSEGGSYSGFFESAVAIVEAAKKMGIQLRLLGAAAIYYQCPKSNLLGDLLKRRLTDLDFITLSKYVSRIPELFSSLKFVPNERVNTLYGANRQIYSDPSNSRHVDIFFDRLSFNHVIDLTRRLDLDPVTISLADLLLEKLQIVKINEKDVKDVIVLMREHGLEDGSAGQLDARYVAKLLANDWGFYYTATTNIKKVRDYLGGIQSLSAADKESVIRGIDDLAQKIESEPKSFKWNMRARLGTRILWYTEAEDVEFRQ